MTKHGQRQHRITEWYLRSFARMTKSGAELAVYDLHTGAFDWHVVSTFMAPINDHSKEIENGSLHVSTHSRQVVERVIEELCYSPESTPGNSALISNSVGVIMGIYSALDGRAMVSADPRAAVPLHSAHAHDRPV